MEASSINMYESAKRTRALRVCCNDAAYDLRYLFSRVEIYPPVKHKKVLRKEHCHDVYHVVLYVRGNEMFNYCGREIDSAPGMLVLTGPGQSHMFGYHEPLESEVEYRNFTFDMIDEEGHSLTLSFAELLALWWNVPMENLDLSPRVLATDELRELLPVLNRAIASVKELESFPAPDEAPAILALFACLLKIFLHKGKDASGSRVDERLLKAIGILDRDIQGKLNITRLARSVGMSRAHFLRCFKKAFGETPGRHSRRYRLEYSKKLLEQGETSFKEIAETVGFCDEFHFSKAFKAEFGETPSAFRKRIENYRT